MNDPKPAEVRDEVTRREWVMILGQVAALAGFSGISPELLAAWPAVEAQPANGLPPGLYYPSQEHLSRALGSMEGMYAIPPGSETEYVRPSSSPFRPQFFSDAEFEMVKGVVEILLGKVDAGAFAQSVQWLDLHCYSAARVREAALKLDPLHRALAVAYYGEEAVREVETADPQIVHLGLAELQQRALQQYTKSFLAIDASQKTNLVTAISTAQPGTPLRKFYEIVRTEAARGYYTSAEGLKELSYKGNWYYSACPGCEQHK